VRGALALEKTLKALEHVLKRRVERRYVLTRFDSRRGMAHRIEAELRERFGEELAGPASQRRWRSRRARSTEGRTRLRAGSRGAQDYEALLEELLATGFFEV